MKFILSFAVAILFALSASAEKVTDAQKSAAQKHIETIKKWDSLKILDPVVTAFTKNPAAEFIKKNKTEVITEAFLNTANGTKIAFLSKPSSWSHKGKAKHDVPMSGKDWIMSDVEKDSSTGLLQFQVAVPILDSGKAIGSLVVGLAVAKL